MAAARGLATKLLQLQGSTGARRLSGTGVGALAGFFSAAAAASASDGGSNACPAYPWPQDAGARGGQKVFMQHDCAACHSMLPYAGLAATDPVRGALEAKAAEIVVVHEAAQPEQAAAAAAMLHGGACPPDLSVIAKMLEGMRLNNLYTADELKKRVAALPTPVWLQFLQPYRT
ncbi:unnamed protein product [Urochloa humidicola]